MSFACMWAIMIFFAVFRGQQLATVMNRYNDAMQTISVRQQYIGRIVTALSRIRFDIVVSGALHEHPGFYNQFHDMLLNREEYIEALQF